MGTISWPPTCPDPPARRPDLNFERGPRQQYVIGRWAAGGTKCTTSTSNGYSQIALLLLVFKGAYRSHAALYLNTWSLRRNPGIRVTSTFPPAT